MRIAWGITGAGDLLEETIRAMISLKGEISARIDVFVSKAGRQILHWYHLWDLLSEEFERVKVEVDANVPFIAGPLQTGRYDVLIVAPLTANSTAKIAYGIEDTLITNTVAQTLKGTTPVILLPVDQHEGTVETVAPDGTRFKIRTRRVDLENVARLREMEGVTVVSSVKEMVERLGALMD